MAIPAGTRLGTYEVTAQIGAGGMGEVYRARDTKLERDVAIKVLPTGLVDDFERLGRFQREARMLAALNHPNIATIHGLEQTSGVHYLVMELVAGQTLAERVRSGPMPVEEAMRIAVQIAEALEAAHEKGIIHRDLKPANVKVTPAGKVKVLDFGLAKSVAGGEVQGLSQAAMLTSLLTEEGKILGTPAYMSPEQVHGEPIDNRSDVFSFGAVLYEMLAGTRAFSGSSVAEIWSAVLRDEPGPLKASHLLNGVIRRCLAKTPAERFQTMAEVRTALEQPFKNPAAEQIRASHLPRGVTRLIGRRRELMEIRDLLLRDDVRLVTLTGAAGIGKTRLAIEVAHEVADDFEQTCFVELEDVKDPNFVSSSLLHGLGLQEEHARSPESCLAVI